MEQELFNSLTKLAIKLNATRGINLEDFCFKEQFAFIEDPAKFKVSVCSRRAGKTVACAAHLIQHALKYPGRVGLYITLSRLNAKRIIWGELLALTRRFGLDVHINETELSLRFGNGSIIYLSGAKDKSEIEKFRGLAISLCYIDEAQSFRSYIKELIDDVIGPALMDYAGTLCLIGTPGPVPAGYFYECSHSDSSWSKHGWTFWQNPHIERKSGESHQTILDRELKRRGLSASDPSVQREWFGKWVLDSDSLLLHYKETLNDYESLPAGKFVYLLGVDIGFNDADALAVLAWNESSPNIYLVEELVQNKQGLTELVQQVEAMQKKYDIAKIVMDEGGLGKKLAEEMRRRHHIPVQPADKVRKMENIAFLNDALRTGRFKAKKKSRFAQDSFILEIDRDKTTPDRIKVKDTYHSDIIDAVLYAFKESPAFAWTPEPPKHKYGTLEWANAEQEGFFSKAQEYFEEQLENAKMPWDEGY